MNRLFLIGQILTFISYSIFWISRFYKSKNNMLIMDIISRIFTICSFVCLGSLNGVQNTIFAVIRNFVGKKVTNKSNKVKIISFIILIAAMIIMYITSFDGLSTVVLVICAIFNIIGAVLLMEQGMRICGLLGNLAYILFQVSIRNYAGIICEAISIIVNLCSFVYYKNKEKLL